MLLTWSELMPPIPVEIPISAKHLPEDKEEDSRRRSGPQAPLRPATKASNNGHPPVRPSPRRRVPPRVLDLIPNVRDAGTALPIRSRSARSPNAFVVNP